MVSVKKFPCIICQEVLESVAGVPCFLDREREKNVGAIGSKSVSLNGYLLTRKTTALLLTNFKYFETKTIVWQ
jgi:hypothetical protein